jgi:hypothetical protein
MRGRPGEDTESPTRAATCHQATLFMDFTPALPSRRVFPLRDAGRVSEDTMGRAALQLKARAVIRQLLLMARPMPLPPSLRGHGTGRDRRQARPGPTSALRTRRALARAGESVTACPRGVASTAFCARLARIRRLGWRRDWATASASRRVINEPRVRGPGLDLGGHFHEFAERAFILASAFLLSWRTVTTH